MTDVRVPLSEDPRMERLEEILREIPEDRRELFFKTLKASCNTDGAQCSTEVDRACEPEGLYGEE
jgi:hypothetical protein